MIHCTPNSARFTISCKNNSTVIKIVKKIDLRASAASEGMHRILYHGRRLWISNLLPYCTFLLGRSAYFVFQLQAVGIFDYICVQILHSIYAILYLNEY